jgi:hypothetical protein
MHELRKVFSALITGRAAIQMMKIGGAPAPPDSLIPRKIQR